MSRSSEPLFTSPDRFPEQSEGALQDLKRNLAGVAVPQITGQAVTLKIRFRVGAPPAP